jgi:hypothetical protein
MTLSSPVIVRLSDAQMIDVRGEAIRRREYAIKRRFQNHNAKVMTPAQMEQIETIGVLGEVAVAEWTGLPWTGRMDGNYNPAIRDVDPYEVKTSAKIKDLWIRGNAFESRPPSQIYIRAIVVAYNAVELIGWASLGYVVDEAEYRKGDDCYVLPANQLQPMETLP